MEITEIRVFLKNQDKINRKLKAYVTLTFDHVFVVRNLKVIEGNQGLFVAMPSRKVQSLCPKCGHNNAIHSRFCNQCGSAQAAQTLSKESTLPSDREAPTRIYPWSGQAQHRDICHPITQEFRDYIQRKVLEAYEKEISKTRSF